MELSIYKNFLTEKYARGREVITWDDDTVPQPISPERTYLIIYSDDRDAEFAAEAERLGFCEMEDYFRELKTFYGLPIDFEYSSVPIGKYTYFNMDSWMVRSYVSSIGRHTSINKTARIERDHPLNMITMNHNSMFDIFSHKDRECAQAVAAQGRKNPSNKIKIGNDVWIGANAFINCSRVSEIGDGAIIGTGAVVLENVPPYAVVVGVPAKIKKYRYTPEEIEVLQRVKWWDWDDETLNTNAQLLIHPEKFFEEFK